MPVAIVAGDTHDTGILLSDVLYEVLEWIMTCIRSCYIGMYRVLSLSRSLHHLCINTYGAYLLFHVASMSEILFPSASLNRSFPRRTVYIRHISP